MSVSANILKRLAALKLPSEAFQEVLSILAELQGADDARREKEEAKREHERVRRAKYPRGHSDGHSDEGVTGMGRSQDRHPPNPLKKERKTPEEPDGSSGNFPTQAELERELFRRGRQVCGKSSGGLISSLLKAKQFDVALARSVIEMAATKHDPREFVGAIIRNNGHGIQPDRAGGRQPSAITAAINGHIERLEREASEEREVREAPAGLLPFRGGE